MFRLALNNSERLALGAQQVSWFSRVKQVAGLAVEDAIQNPAVNSTMRIVWVLVIVFTQIIGAIIYLANTADIYIHIHYNAPAPTRCITPPPERSPMIF